MKSGTKSFTIYRRVDGKPVGVWEDDHPDHEDLLEEGWSPVHTFDVPVGPLLPIPHPAAYAYYRGYLARYLEDNDKET